MSSMMGDRIRVSIFGQSHGAAIGAVLWSEVAYHRKQRRLYK